MTPTILLGLIVALPALAIVLLRSDASIVLLSLCAGNVLVKFIGSDATVALTRASNNTRIAGWAYVGLLLVPALLSLLALRKSVSSIKMPLNLLTAIAVGVAIALLAVPLMPSGAQTQITNSFAWSQLSQYNTAIISGCITIALITLWLGGKKHGHRKHH